MLALGLHSDQVGAEAHSLRKPVAAIACVGAVAQFDASHEHGEQGWLVVVE